MFFPSVSLERGYAYGALEKALFVYCEQTLPSAPFDLSTIPTIATSDDHAQQLAKKLSGMEIHPVESKATSQSTPAAPSAPLLRHVTSIHKRTDHASSLLAYYAEQLIAVPRLHALGKLLHSSESVALTEPETEYVVDCVKHVYAKYVVLQFNVKNTLASYLLDNVTVQTTNDTCTPLFSIPVTRIALDETERVFVVYERPDDMPISMVFTNTLRFILRECDSETREPIGKEGSPDEYQLEDIDVSLSDFIMPAVVGDFKTAWDALGEELQARATFELGAFSTIASASKSMIDMMGMEVSRPPSAVLDPERLPSDLTSYILLLTGSYGSDATTVLVRARLVLVSSGVTMEVSVRSPGKALNEWIVESVS
jgi:coatomer protein complex subunit gamma